VIISVKTFKTNVIGFFFGIKRHTDWYFPVLVSLSWYWQYQSVRSNKKMSKLPINFIIAYFIEITPNLHDCSIWRKLVKAE
jgi:hypothetical protein